MIRVLIAEDEPPIARAIKALIERLDGELVVAGMAQDGEEALRMMEERPFDLIFTDIRMPMMNGLQLLEVLKARWPDALSVVVSGYGTFEYSSQALRASAFDYILKPVQEDEMRELLSRIRDELAQRARHKLHRLMASGLNIAKEAPEDLGDKAMLVALVSAPDEGYWDSVNLELLIRELLGELGSFTWVFMGDMPEERVVLLEDRPGMVELMTYVHEYMLGSASVGCACTADGVALTEMRATIRRLRDALRNGDGRFALVDEMSPQPSTLNEAARLLVAQVKRYIDEQFSTHITNQVLSDAFGYVPSYISMLFKKAHGQSPTEYLSEVRLDHARALMVREPMLMVKEIAERVGFKNQYHFSKAFKRYTGQWPTDYIRQLK